MIKNWENIWSSKKSDINDTHELADLLKLGGFDSGAGTVNTNDWINYVNHVKKTLGIKDNDSVFEYGCGAGAFLKALNIETVGGCDYSQSLIDVANKELDGTFFQGEAYPTEPDKQYDWCISNSVFHYFPDHAYARNVISKMFMYSNKGIAILDVIDYDTKDAYEEMRFGSTEDYKNKYNGLEHLTYTMEWFINFIKHLHVSIEFEPQVLENYPNAPYRYNVYIKQK